MKHIHALVVVAALFLGPMALLATDMSANLQSFWELSDLDDSHGSNGLTNVGGATFSAGKVGNAVNLNGSSQYLTMADNAALSMGDIDFTVQAWFKVTSLAPPAQVVVCKCNIFGISGTMEFGIYVVNDGTVRFRIDAGLGSYPTVISGTTITVDTWYHVIGYHDAQTDTIGIIVNNGTPVTGQWLYGSQDTSQPLNIGLDGDTGRYFGGQIDQVGVWKRKLSSAEIAELYNGGSGRTYDEVTGGEEPPSCVPTGDLICGDQVFSTYLGGFRMPSTTSNGISPDRAPNAIAFNPENGKMFIAAKGGYVAEINIPPLEQSSNPTAMRHATYSQGFINPIEGMSLGLMDYCTEPDRASGACNGVALNSIAVENGRLLMVYGISYDAGNVQLKSHLSRPVDLSTTGDVAGPTQFGDTTGGLDWTHSGTHPVTGGPYGQTGFTSGYLANIPAARQAALGGKVASGHCCPSVITRTSYGPALGGFDPIDIGAGSEPRPWFPWVAYPSTHQTLGAWEAAGTYFGISTAVWGSVIFEDTDTVAFFGRQSTTYCYGNGTSNPELHGEIGPDGEKWCYTLTSTSKANHGYPYYYAMWLYDINQFIAVKNGTKEAWQVEPYQIYSVPFPIVQASNQEPVIRGATWDPATRRLFLSQYSVDQTNCEFCGIVQVYQVPTP